MSPAGLVLDLASPRVENGLRHVALGRPLIGPRKNFPAGLGAQFVGPGRDSDTAQVQTVGIPAALERRIALCMAVGMQPTRLVEQFELER